LSKHGNEREGGS